MSVESYTVPFFYTGPKIHPKEWGVLASTSYIKQACLLFSTRRTVACDRIKQEIRITSRKWWFLVKKRTLPFSEIDYIDRVQFEIPTSFGFVPGGFGRHDSLQSITVCAVTRDKNEKVPLFEFWGEGSENTGWFGSMFGDALIDIHGGQENAAIYFADLVAKTTGTRFGILNEVKIPSKANGRKLYCATCNHQLAPNAAACIYCGSTDLKEEP